MALIYVLGDEKVTFLNHHPDYKIYVNENNALMHDNSDDPYVVAQGWGHHCLQSGPDNLDEVIYALNSRYKDEHMIVVYDKNRYEPFIYFDLANQEDVQEAKEYFKL